MTKMDVANPAKAPFFAFCPYGRSYVQNCSFEETERDKAMAMMHRPTAVFRSDVRMATNGSEPFGPVLIRAKNHLTLL
jgi:hypothetical protein